MAGTSWPPRGPAQQYFRSLGSRIPRFRHRSGPSERSPAGTGSHRSSGSADGRFVFVSLEDSNELAVFNLGRAARLGFGRSDLVGYVPMGVAPVGMAISADGRYLFATSEADSPTSTEGR